MVACSIATRFGDVEQLHRVAMPLGAREQLTFYREPVTNARSPQSAVAPGFVFLKDQGGNEYAQVYWYDTATRAVRMLTDGKGLHGGLVWSHDGRRVAFHGTGRDGVSYDLFIAEPANNFARRVWSSTAFRRTGRCRTGRPTTPACSSATSSRRTSRTCT